VINPESLLLEGARRVDEWSLIEKKVPSFDIIFIVDHERLDISEATLTETQQRILPLLDGSRDVNQIIEDSGLGEFEIGKALYGLITAGFLHRAGRTTSAEQQKMSDARVEEHRNLGVAFYKTGMLDEAAREFRRVAELRAGDPNALFFLGLVALKQARWREAMESLRSAAEKGGSRPAVLHNLGYAYEQLGRLDEAEAACAEAASRARTDPRVYLGWGIVALKRGDHSGAGGRLDRAKELYGAQQPPAVWYWARALAAGLGSDFESAEHIGAAGIAAYPQSAVLRNNLAVLRELSGDLRGAEDLVRVAIQDEPSQPQLSKNLGDLVYRASRYDEVGRRIAGCELAPDLGDDVYFAGQHRYKRSDRARRPALAAGPRAEPEPRAAKTNLETLSTLPRASRRKSRRSGPDRQDHRRAASASMRMTGVEAAHCVRRGLRRHSFADYSRLRRRRASDMLDALTINVTKFFRTRRRALTPHLVTRWRASAAAAVAWSAGCASGEESYTVAIALAEVARSAPSADRLARVRVIATYIDRVSLERARAARYPATAFSEMPVELARRWLDPAAPDGTRAPVAAIRALVDVRRLDLTRERPPEIAGGLDLIVCRNVVIYFDRETQERLFHSFAEALKPAGVLLLGKVETLLGPARERLRLLDARERIYLRPA
jgi:chemotaxis methyl-accepting protein methylase/Flp pilus assembly protein TadD